MSINSDSQRIAINDKGEQQFYMEVQSMGGRENVGILDSIPIDQVQKALTDIALSIGHTLQAAKPQKASVELGVEFGLEEGKLVALIARGTGKANLKVKLEWETK